MKSRLIFVFIFFVSLIYCQRKLPFDSIKRGKNPWVIHVYGENPWVNEYTQENPWEIELSEKNPWGEAYNLERNRIKNEKDTLTKISEIENENPELLALSKYSLRDIRYQAYSEFRGTNSFWCGFLYGFILNFYGLIPSIITVAIPSTNERIAVENFKRKYKNPSENQIKFYKKGTKNKRISRTISGLATGSLSQIAFILIILILTF
jgi:hypothetical protein